MNTAAIFARPLPHPIDCQAAVWARRVGATLFAVVVVALEAWLRVPVQPVLEGHLQQTLARISSLAAVARKIFL